ncbi:hypothetical protein K466DRAFT_445413, partial [Polyporus arcularius HHB13444]
PQWLADHPELAVRNIKLTVCLRAGKVWQTGSVPLYAVKLLANNGVEASMYEMLMSCPGLSNHTLPAQLIRCPQGDILLMPLLESLLGRGGAWNIDVFLDIFTQILQGIEFLHEHRITHMDFHAGNVVVGTTEDAAVFPEVVPERVYIIDFECAMHHPQGPGQQGPVDLTESLVQCPAGVRRMDPYAWDMYCVG